MSPMRTVPVTRASGIVSCMRLRQRIKVDLPQPEGPISAVAWLAATVIWMSYNAWVLPYQAFRFSTLIPTPILCCSEGTTAYGNAHGRDCSDDKHNEDQRARPRLPVPLVVRRNGVGENLQRERRGRLVGPQIPELVAECREQQRRGFARDPGKGQHDPSNHSGGCAAQSNGEG